jgi:hypothetical protein
MPHMVDMERIAADCKKKHGYGAPAALMGSLSTGGSPFHTRVARLLVLRVDDNLDRGSRLRIHNAARMPCNPCEIYTRDAFSRRFR